MQASLTWLDLTARDRDKMRRVIDLFNEQGTVDEMGLRIPAMMTADSGERDRLAQPSLTGAGFLLGPVTFRQAGLAGAAHRFTAQRDAMSAV